MRRRGSAHATQTGKNRKEPERESRTSLLHLERSKKIRSEPSATGTAKSPKPGKRRSPITNPFGTLPKRSAYRLAGLIWHGKASSVTTWKDTTSGNSTGD